MDKYDSNIELNQVPDKKVLAEKELMEEIKRGEQSGEKHGYIDISESKARLGL